MVQLNYYDVVDTVSMLIIESGIARIFLDTYEEYISDRNLSTEEQIKDILRVFITVDKSLFISYTNDDSGIDVNGHNVMETICCILSDRIENLSSKELFSGIKRLVEIVISRSVLNKEVKSIRDSIYLYRYFEENIYQYIRDNENYFKEIQNTYASDCSWNRNEIMNILMLALCLFRGNVSKLYDDIQSFNECLIEEYDIEPSLKSKMKHTEKLIRSNIK